MLRICFVLLTFICLNGIAQSSLDSLRMVLPIGHTEHVNSAVFSPDGKYVLTASWDKTARIYEVTSGKELLVLSMHKDHVNSAVFSPDGKYVLTASSDGKARIFYVKSGKQVHKLSGHKSDVESAVFSSDGKFAITSGRDGTVRIYEVSSGRQLQVLEGHSHAVFSPDGKYALTPRDATSRIYDVLSGKEIQVLSGHTSWVKSAVFSPDGKYALTASDDGTARIYEVSSGEELNVLSGHTSYVNSAFFSPDGKFILTTGYDHKTILWDAVGGKQICERIQLENDIYIVKLCRSSYYTSSKDASKLLHYVTPSLKVIGFDQLDPVYNRPDIVLDSIGKYFGGADQELLDSYRLAWERRVERLGLDKEKLATGEIAVPNAEIVNEDLIDYTNSEGRVVIHMKANDPKYALLRYNVLVNEVPVYGSEGISIAAVNTKVWEHTDTISLSKGTNKIQVSVMNELGLENFKYPAYVNYTPPSDQDVVSTTHYIGIGVNHFQDVGHDLKYCVKDVEDLASAFGGNHTVTKLFTENEVKRENILQLKQYLLDSTTVHDKVIISCSSHGLLDDSLNFYLATYDVDFRNPKMRGLKYEELEGLLDGIPARQKLLLLDACNSGENDKTEQLRDELKKAEEQEATTEILAYREKTKGVIVQLEQENTSTFKKMNELFVNVRNNTGSIIISAAGGQESALEAIDVSGQKIENGAFTYCILEYLRTNEGNHEVLTVGKLKEYVENRVEIITNGKQKPTSRQETMEVDWSVR
jgi:dipeptidyl aminopeptidase/acylaminoacyl peptidase